MASRLFAFSRNSFKNHWPLLLIILLSLVPLTWFKEGLVLAGGDNYRLLNPAALFNDFIHTWQERYKFGIPNIETFQLFPLGIFWEIFTVLGFASVSIEKIWLVCIFFLTGSSIYLLFLHLSQEESHRVHLETQWGALITATLYMFNMWVSIDVITPVVRLVAAFLPFFVLLWIKGLNQVRFSWRYQILIGFLSIFITSAYANPLAVLMIPIVLLTYSIFFLLTTRGKIVSTICFVLTTMVCFMGFNLWWFLPYITSSIDIYPAIEKAFESYDYLLSTHIFDTFRFLGFWAFRSFYDEPRGILHVPYSHYYYEPLFLIMGFLLPILSISVLCLRSKNRYVVFLFLLSLVGVFFSKGANPPFGFIYSFLYKNLPGFAAFREPFARFTGIQVFALSILLGFFVEYCARPMDKLIRNNLTWISRRTLPLAVLIFILVLSFPILTGKVLQSKSWHGNAYESLEVSVPTYWSDLDKWLRENDPEAKFLVLPHQNYGGCYDWSSGACTAGPVAQILLSNPQVSSVDQNLYFGDSNISNLFAILNPNDNYDLSGIFSFFGIDYVLVQDDYLWQRDEKSTNPEALNKWLLNRPEVSFKGRFGRLSLYEFNGRRSRTLFRLASNYELIHGENGMLPERLLLTSESDAAKLNLIYSSQKYSPSEAVLNRSVLKFFDLDKVDQGDGFKDHVFNVPETGEYELFIKNRGFTDDFPQSLEYKLSGQSILPLRDKVPVLPSWSTFGKLVLSAGDYRFETRYHPSGDLFPKEEFFNAVYQVSASSKDTPDSNDGFWALPASYESKVSFAPFKAVSANGYYKISFWYKNLRGKLQYVGVQHNNCLVVMTPNGFDSSELLKPGCRNYYYYSPAIEPAPAWRHFAATFQAGPDSKTAFLFFQFSQSNSLAYVTTPKISRAFDQLVTLWKPLDQAPEARGQISFHKINPAKYLVTVTGAQSRHELIFNSGFNRNWKAYPTNQQSSSWWQPFETLFLKPLPESRHFLVNDYANAWEIRPDDLAKNSNGDYSLIIEYQAERLYMLGLVILFLTIVFGSTYILFPVFARGLKGIGNGKK